MKRGDVVRVRGVPADLRVVHVAGDQALVCCESAKAGTRFAVVKLSACVPA